MVPGAFGTSGSLVILCPAGFTLLLLIPGLSEQLWACLAQSLLQELAVDGIGECFIQHQVVFCRIGQQLPADANQALLFSLRLLQFFFQTPAVLLDSFQAALELAAFVSQDCVGTGIVLRCSVLDFCVVDVFVNLCLVCGDCAELLGEFLQLRRELFLLMLDGLLLFLSGAKFMA